MAPQQQPAPIDTLFQSYTRDLYKITGQEQEDSLLDMIDNNQPNANQSSSVNVDAASVNSGVSTATTQQASGSSQSGFNTVKAILTSTVAGYFLGVTKGVAQFAIGTSTSYFQFDGTNVEMTGTIVASNFSFLDSSGNTVMQGGGSGGSSGFVLEIDTTSNVNNGIKVVMTQSASDAILISTTVSGNGFYYSNTSNVGNRGIYVEQTNTGSSNTLPCIEVHHSTNTGNVFAIYSVGANAAGCAQFQISGTGTALSVINTGTGYSINIEADTSGALGILAVNSHTGGSGYNFINFQDSGGGTVVNIASSASSANYALIVTHAAGGTAAVQINQNAYYTALELNQTADSNAACYGTAITVANNGAGDCYGLNISVSNSGGGKTYFAYVDGGSVVNAGVGGSNTYKLKISIGGTDFFIPCYTS